MGRKMIDITGQKFGHWTVINKSEKIINSHAICWNCQCDCGNFAIIAGVDLRAGKTLQCKNCAAKERAEKIKQKLKQEYKQNNKDEHIKRLERFNNPVYKSEIGKQYGNLTILRLSDKEVQLKSQNVKFRCLCICGNEIDVRMDYLHNGKTTSCGCIKSRGEAIIHKILQDNHINYVSEYSFNDLIGLNGGKLRFDFAIFNADNQLVKLIEFQGRQHFEETKLWNNDNKIHDQYKREYCKEHDIELLEIPYYDINKIDLNYLGLITCM